MNSINQLIRQIEATVKHNTTHKEVTAINEVKPFVECFVCFQNLHDIQRHPFQLRNRETESII